MIGVQGRSNYPAQQPNLYNRTSGALSLYGVYAVDIRRTNATYSLDEDSSNAGVVAVDSNNLICARLAVAQDTAASNTLSKVVTKGFTQCQVSNAGAITLPAGSLLIPVNGQTYLGSIAAAITNLASCCAILNGTVAANASAVVSVDFRGSSGGCPF